MSATRRSRARSRIRRSYTDYALTVSKDFSGVVVSGAVIGTDADKTFYVSPVNGKELGKTTFVLGAKVNF